MNVVAVGAPRLCVQLDGHALSLRVTVAPDAAMALDLPVVTKAMAAQTIGCLLRDKGRGMVDVFHLDVTAWAQLRTRSDQGLVLDAVAAIALNVGFIEVIEVPRALSDFIPATGHEDTGFHGCIGLGVVPQRATAEDDSNYHGPEEETAN